MRVWFLFVSAIGCGVGEPEPGTDPCARYGAGVRRCGQTAPCMCCEGCSISDGLCMGPEQRFTASYGNCAAEPGIGTFSVMIDGVAFAATQVASASDTEYVQISATAKMRSDSGTTTRVVVLRVPAVLGTHDCAADPVSAISLFDDGQTASNQQAVASRPACTVTLMQLGAVGERVEGSFAATLVSGLPMSPAPTVELSGGTFSVELGAWP